MKRFIPIVILLILSFLAVRPLFSSTYFPIHDDTQVERVVAMGRALKEGQFPVRWVSDLGYGYGYPVFNFYGPLPYYVGGLLYALGLPALLATKTMFGLGIVLPSLMLYIVLSPIVGWLSAIVASVFYLYAPYHAVQVYVRGAVGEYWELLFWPFLLYACFWSAEKTCQKRSIIAGAVGLFGSIVSHTLLGYATTTFLILGMACYWLWKFTLKRVNRNELKTQVSWFALGLGMSAFFWLPALLELQYTNVSAQVSNSANYLDHFVCLIQLWSSPWGFGGSAPGCVRDGLSFMLGKLHIIISTVAVVGWVIGRYKSINRAFLTIAGVCTVVGIFLTTRMSEPLWRILPMFSYLQYPWRFLALGTFGLSLLSGVAVVLIRHPIWRGVVAVSLIAMVLLMNAKWFVPQNLYTTAPGAFETNQDIRWRASRISDEYLSKEFVRPTDESGVVSATIESRQPIRVTTIITTAVEKEFVVESTTAAQLTINIANFPGWRYRINGMPVKPVIRAGLPRLSVSPGQSIVSARLTDTPIRLIGNILSGISIVIMIFIYVKQRKIIR